MGTMMRARLIISGVPSVSLEYAYVRTNLYLFSSATFIDIARYYQWVVLTKIRIRAMANQCLYVKMYDLSGDIHSCKPRITLQNYIKKF